MELRLTIAPGLIKSFLEILHGLSTFFGHLKTKERYLQALTRLKDPEETRKRKAIYAQRKRLCIEAYMEAVSKGLEPREAISKANRALKSKGHKWVSYDIVLSIVREAGLLKGTDFYKRKNGKKGV